MVQEMAVVEMRGEEECVCVCVVCVCVSVSVRARVRVCVRARVSALAENRCFTYADSKYTPISSER